VSKNRRWTRAIAGLVALSYLGLGVLLWGSAWAHGASTHTLCGCGDPSLFLWFFQWPATALAHGHNPLYSQALFHPGGINLLAQTSVLGLSLPLVPVTWIFGPVAALNVASTLVPALSAFVTFMVLRRWVSWTPARFVGGLLYGFSPFVLTSLQFAHLMTAALMLLPLMLAVLDDIVFRQVHSARWGGIWLGVLLFLQFFLSTELMAVIALTVVATGLVLVVAALALNRPALVHKLPHAVEALVLAAVVGGVLLIYPVYFALDGPAHLSGLIWPNLGAIGGYDISSFLGANLAHGHNVLSGGITGYEGTPLPSSGYLGWGLIVVLAGGLFVWIKDRRIVFFGFLLVLCFWFSLGERRSSWNVVPARAMAHLPVLENVIEQRFMAIGFLAAAVMLALILDHVRSDFPTRVKAHGAGARALGVGAAVAAAAAALVPMGSTFASSMPFAMRPVVLPSWYRQVAPKLPPGRVVLPYPAAFSGIQSAMDWQAVDAMSFSQAGGGGPQGVPNRAGSAKTGFIDLAALDFGFRGQPTGTQANFAAVRHAIAAWGVNTVVIAPDPGAPTLQQGHDPTYAAAFMTAALGRMPVIEAGAWVWNNVSVTPRLAAGGAAWHVNPSALATCTALVERPTLTHPEPYHPTQPASLRISQCVALEAL
jgi:dolichyl-phosphate beta-glucosyltransferase